MKRTFLTDVVKMGYSEDEIFAVLVESEQDRNRRRVLATVNETVAVHRLQQMKDLQALEKLATWRRVNDFDRVADGEDNWFHGPRLLLPTPEEFAASLWSKVNALKDAISMPARARLWQKTMEFVDGLKGKLPDEDLAAIKRHVRRRSREAAQATVTPVSTVQHCTPCSLNSEMPPDVCVSLQSNEGKVDPERDELESPSAGTGFEIPGQQCHPIWETGRTTADGFLTAGVGSNQRGNISSPTERVDTRAVRTTTPTSAASNINFLQQSHKPKDEDKDNEENKEFDSGGNGEKASLWSAAVMVVFSFPGENAGPGVPVVFASCFFCLCVFLLCSLFIVHSGDHFSASWKT